MSQTSSIEVFPNINKKSTYLKFLYSLIITKSIVCIPSHLLFMSIFEPSRYESKLWDLKKILKKDSYNEIMFQQFADIKVRYHTNTSNFFESMIDEMLNKLIRLENSHFQYRYYTLSILDLELIRIQPLRYIWNENDKLDLYGSSLTSIACTWKIFEKQIKTIRGPYLIFAFNIINFFNLSSVYKPPDKKRINIRYEKHQFE